MNENKPRLWRMTLTEEQLKVLIDAVEDWHRFLSGQCTMWNATSLLGNNEVKCRTREILGKDVEAAMFPELPFNSIYPWCGGQPDHKMSKAAAISYMIYREALHQLALVSTGPDWDVYRSDTPICGDQGPIVKLEKIEE